MELDWFTFTLEVVNFLILVWILQRFLYKPILQTIARRKAAIEQTLADAKKRQTDAEALEHQYRDRLEVWGEEKRKLRDQVDADIEAERALRMAALQQTLDREREKHEALEQRQLRDQQRQMEHEALAQGAQFAAGLLQRLAAPELERRLVGMVVEELPKLRRDIVEEVRRIRAGTEPYDVKVASAFPVNPAERETLERELRTLLNAKCAVTYSIDVQLLAGIRVEIGPWVLRANLQDELKFFAETSHRAV